MTRTVFSGVKAKASGAEPTGNKGNRDLDGQKLLGRGITS